jgi:hypothetical protein
VGGLERWIARQRRWEAVPGGWTVPGELQGWRFRLELAPGGVRVIASAGGGEPAVWFVPGRRCNCLVAEHGWDPVGLAIVEYA